MAYDWVENSKSEGKGRAPRLPAGQHDLTIVEVIFGGKKGKFASASGDPQILVVFEDGAGNQCSEMITLSDKAAWKIAQILAAAGADMNKLKASGIEPAKFAEERFATVQLVGRKITASVDYETGKDGKDYARVTPLRPDPSEAQTPAAVNDDVPV